MTRAAKILFLPILLLQVCFFVYVSLHRLIDIDKGFYLLASRLVLQHRTPYLDFFYTQAPLLPYVYAAWLKTFGITWISARIFSALLTATVGGLLYWQVCRETGKWIAGLVAVYLFAGSSLVFAWYPIVKTFALAVLFLFAAYMILARLAPRTSPWLMAAAGILVALAVDTRSYLLAVLPVFLWWIVRRLRPHPLPMLALFGTGFLVGLLPCLLLFFASPDRFWFNNLGYHALRTAYGLVGNWHSKLMVTLGVLGGSHTGFQFSVLTVTAVGFAVARRKVREATLLALVVAVVIGLVSLLPTPPSVQYFCMLIPFLIAAAVGAVSDSFDATAKPQFNRKAAITLVALLVAFAGFGFPSFRQYLFTGYRVPGVMTTAAAPDWTLQRVAAISKAMDELAVPGETVASFWPGYVFASHAEPYPGFENNFGMVVAPQVTPQQRREYHIVSGTDVVDDVAKREPRIWVLVNQEDWVAAPQFAICVSILRANGYTRVSQLGNASLYVYRPGGR